SISQKYYDRSRAESSKLFNLSTLPRFPRTPRCGRGASAAHPCFAMCSDWREPHPEDRDAREWAEYLHPQLLEPWRWSYRYRCRLIPERLLFRARSLSLCANSGDIAYSPSW